MAQAKIELRLGTFQFTGEAEAVWLEKQLDKLLEHVKSVDLDQGFGRLEQRPNEGKTRRKAAETTATIAAKLGCKVGAGKDVITAAAARLTLVANKESFTRAELLEEAKTATGYYKKTVANNLSNTLKELVKVGELSEISSGTYSLSATKRQELEKRLAS